MESGIGSLFRRWMLGALVAYEATLESSIHSSAVRRIGDLQEFKSTSRGILVNRYDVALDDVKKSL